MKTRSLANLLEQIHKLSSAELKRQTELLAEQEHLQGARLIAHLAEVSLRRLHLEREIEVCSNTAPSAWV